MLGVFLRTTIGLESRQDVHLIFHFTEFKFFHLVVQEGHYLGELLGEDWTAEQGASPSERAPLTCVLRNQRGYTYCNTFLDVT